MVDIDEGIIPMNMRWRAGIGKDIKKQDIQSYNTDTNILYDGGIKLTRVNEPVKYPYNNVDLTDQLLPEIDTQVTEVLKKYNKLDGRTTLNIKEDLKRVCLNIKSKYKMYLNEGFYNSLYNTCNTAFNEFIKLKDGINSMTEFIEIDGKIYGNPSLVYGYFQL